MPYMKIRRCLTRQIRAVSVKSRRNPQKPPSVRKIFPNFAPEFLEKNQEYELPAVLGCSSARWLANRQALKSAYPEARPGCLENLESNI
jgi:hypothetical protein